MTHRAERQPAEFAYSQGFRVARGLPDSWRGDHGGFDATFPCKFESQPEQKTERPLTLRGCEKSRVHAWEIALREHRAAQIDREQNGGEQSLDQRLGRE